LLIYYYEKGEKKKLDLSIRDLFKINIERLRWDLLSTLGLKSLVAGCFISSIDEMPINTIRGNMSFQ